MKNLKLAILNNKNFYDLLNELDFQDYIINFVGPNLASLKKAIFITLLMIFNFKLKFDQSL